MRTLAAIIFLGLSGAALEGKAAPTEPRRPTRLEFDPRVVRGQRAGAESIYLFERAPLAPVRLVEPRASFRQLIEEEAPDAK